MSENLRRKLRLGFLTLLTIGVLANAVVAGFIVIKWRKDIVRLEKEANYPVR